MPRKVTASLERKVSPDRKYQSVLVQRLINKSMLDGKKHVAERAVYSAIEGAAKKTQLRFSSGLSRTLAQTLKLSPAVLVVLTTRFHFQSPAIASCISQ